MGKKKTDDQKMPSAAGGNGKLIVIDPAALDEAVARLAAEADDMTRERAIAALSRRTGVSKRIIVRMVDRARADLAALARGSRPQEPAEAEIGSMLDDLPADVPRDLVVPPGYRIAANGRVLRQAGDPDGLTLGGDAEAEETTVCPVPLLVAARARDADTDEVRVTLAWRAGGEWHRATVPRSMIADTRRIVGLADLDLPVTTPTARALVSYLSAFELANRGRLPEKAVVSTLGWRVIGGRRVFVVGERRTVGRAPVRVSVTLPGPGERTYMEALQPGGSLDGWVRELYARALAYPKVLLAIWAALAAPLLALMGATGWTLHLAGRSTLGKTTALQAAASCWGYPGGPQLPSRSAQLYETWGTSLVHLEQRLAFARHLPVFLDEIALAKPRELVGQALYLVANGAGRGRGAKDGGTRVTPTWCLVAISTGERLARTATAYSGGAVRAVELYGTVVDGKEVAEAIRQAAGRHYGHAGPLVVVEAMRAGEDTLRQWHQGLTAGLAALASDDLTARLAGSYAAMVVAGALLHRALARAGVTALPGDDEVTGIAREAFVAQAAEPPEAMDLAALHAIMGWCATHPAALVPPDGDVATVPVRRRAGLWRTVVDQQAVLALEAGSVRQILLGAGYHDHQAIVRGLRERGILATRPGHLAVPLRLGSGRAAPVARCYAFLWDRLAELGYHVPGEA